MPSFRPSTIAPRANTPCSQSIAKMVPHDLSFADILGLADLWLPSSVSNPSVSSLWDSPSATPEPVLASSLFSNSWESLSTLSMSTTLSLRSEDSDLVRHSHTRRILESTVGTAPRLDLSSTQLLFIAIFRIYVHRKFNDVAILMNQGFELRPRLTTDDAQATYTHLHDTEHVAWTRARDMNRMEKDLLRTILKKCGVPREEWDIDIVHPLGPMAFMRLEGA